LIGDLPINVLGYVHSSWLDYLNLYRALGPPFQRRREPQLTQALGAYLREREDQGFQPVAGQFFAESNEFILTAEGLPKAIARTDIEWRLYGFPVVIIEFKLLDGKAAKRKSYLLEGVHRFVAGRYAGKSWFGAMFGLLRKKAEKDPALLATEIMSYAQLNCTGVSLDSELLPGTASFDSTHNRVSPHLSPFRLAHLFVLLPQ
jgi:hypothetical protein